MNTMPCGLEDDRVRFEPEEEDNDPRTDLEKRLDWVCDEWSDASKTDQYENWRDLRMMIFGATMALIQCNGREAYETREALRALRAIAFEHGTDALHAGRWEGAK